MGYQQLWSYGEQRDEDSQYELDMGKCYPHVFVSVDIKSVCTL